MSDEHPKPLSMRIEPQFQRDPLKKPIHRVLMKSEAGYTIMGTAEDPIELLKLEVEGQHAVGMPNTDMLIVDENNVVEAKYDSYHVDPQDGPPTEERLKVRDRWLEAVMRFLLPPGLYADQDKPERQERIKRWFKSKKIEIQIRPDGGAVQIWRDGVVLTKWGC